MSSYNLDGDYGVGIVLDDGDAITDAEDNEFVVLRHTRRRVFEGRTDLGQVLVIYNPSDDTFHVAQRSRSETVWGPPMRCSRIDDDQ